LRHLAFPPPRSTQILAMTETDAPAATEQEVRRAHELHRAQQDDQAQAPPGRYELAEGASPSGDALGGALALREVPQAASSPGSPSSSSSRARDLVARPDPEIECSRVIARWKRCKL